MSQKTPGPPPLRDTVPHKTQGWGHTQKCQQKQLIDVTAKTIYN